MRVCEYVRPSGLRVERDVIVHAGAVVIVPVVDEHLLLVRQPREAVERYLLELPAGKLDVPGEPPLECAKRELAEEAGHRAASWEDLGGFFTVPAILTEFIHCFLATELEPVHGAAIPEEEIEVVRWPVDDIDTLLDELVDAKSLIGVHRYARRIKARHSERPSQPGSTDGSWMRGVRVPPRDPHGDDDPGASAPRDTVDPGERGR